METQPLITFADRQPVNFDPHVVNAIQALALACIILAVFAIRFARNGR